MCACVDLCPVDVPENLHGDEALKQLSRHLVVLGDAFLVGSEQVRQQP